MNRAAGSGRGKNRCQTMKPTRKTGPVCLTKDLRGDYVDYARRGWKHKLRYCRHTDGQTGRAIEERDKKIPRAKKTEGLEGIPGKISMNGHEPRP